LVKLSTIFVDNLKILHETAERSSKTHGIPVVFEDLDGMRITRLPDEPEKKPEDEFIKEYIYCPICKEIYRERNSDGARYCNISDRDASWTALAMRLGIPFLFRCHAGLSNFLIPITAGGSPVGNVFGGEFFIQREGRKDVDDTWIRTMAQKILDRWTENNWWPIAETKIEGEYITHLKEFLLGPESGGSTISEFIAVRNRKAEAEEKKERIKVIPTSLTDKYKETIYGIDPWELIEDLVDKIWRKKPPNPIVESVKKMRKAGFSCPSQTIQDIGRFLDILRDYLANEADRIDAEDIYKRQRFIDEYQKAIEENEKYRLYSRPLESMLNIIVKLHSEADTLSHLATERYYLKLFEGVSSHIPEIVENQSKLELGWIRENIRKLAIELGAEKSLNGLEYRDKVLEINRKFFSVLSKMQEYQDGLAGALIKMNLHLLEIRRSPSSNLNRFFDSYRASLSSSGTVGEEIDRCERVYLAYIFKLMQHPVLVSEDEEKLRKEERSIDALAEEKKAIERDRSIEQEKKIQKLNEIEMREKPIKQKIEELTNELVRYDREIKWIDSNKDRFLQSIYKCKKLYEDFRQKLDTVYYDVEKKLEPELKRDDKTLDPDKFDMCVNLVGGWGEFEDNIGKLEKDHDLLVAASGKMQNELHTLEKIVSSEDYDSEKSKDNESIGIIGIKDWETDRLGKLNDTMARLMGLYEKRGFHIRFDTVYFNAGGLAPVHTDIEQEQKKWMIERDETGPVSDETEKRIDRELGITRKYLSFLLGAKESEIVLTDSTTEGIFLTLNAIKFEHEDEIITTDSEHDVVRYLCERIKESHAEHGIVIDIRSYSKDKIIDKITVKTRLVIFSDILFTTGDRLESEKIIATCRQKYENLVDHHKESHRSEGILFLVDGAQSAGQTAIDLEKMKCDFFAMDGHKWLSASEGSGALFVREKFLRGDDKTVNFTFIKNYMVTDWEDGFHPKDKKTGRHYELATINLASKVGLKSAIQIIARSGFLALSDGLGSNPEERNALGWKALEDAFDKKGELKEINIEILNPDLQRFKNSDLGPFMDIQPSHGKSYLVTQKKELTEKLIRECLREGVARTREAITRLKDHFWQRFSELEKDLKSTSEVTVERVTKEGNEGGVVGFRLIRNTEEFDKKELSFETHQKLKEKLELDFNIIFRVIPPPYPPAIRVCLHKYNTTTEIDLFYYALRNTIPTLLKE
jgi:selenocysteine lyase/cysteine desulfurase/ligand-binding sensor protein